MVRYVLAIWGAVERYVGTVIEANYASDDAIRRDAELQTWIKASGDPAQGNVAGLPRMDTMDALKGVLTSLIFRVTAHGAARLNQAANPANPAEFSMKRTGRSSSAGAIRPKTPPRCELV